MHAEMGSRDFYCVAPVASTRDPAGPPLEGMRITVQMLAPGDLVATTSNSSRGIEDVFDDDDDDGRGSSLAYNRPRVYATSQSQLLYYLYYH
jgi:hypothetical protein